MRIIMKHLERIILRNWDSCYSDNQDDQNSGNKSSQRQEILVSIGLSSSTKLEKKNSKDQTIPTKII